MKRKELCVFILNLIACLSNVENDYYYFIYATSAKSIYLKNWDKVYFRYLFCVYRWLFAVYFISKLPVWVWSLKRKSKWRDDTNSGSGQYENNNCRIIIIVNLLSLINIGKNFNKHSPSSSSGWSIRPFVKTTRSWTVNT